MTQNIFTPGPWIARPYPESKVGRITITGKSSPVPIAEIIPITMKGYDAPAEANGRLIAAAPQLLSALKILVADLDDAEEAMNPETGMDYSTVRLARAAIAKATGGAS